MFNMPFMDVTMCVYDFYVQSIENMMTKGFTGQSFVTDHIKIQSTEQQLMCVMHGNFGLTQTNRTLSFLIYKIF